MKNKIFLFPLSLAVIFFSSMIIIFSPIGRKNIVTLPAPSPVSILYPDLSLPIKSPQKITGSIDKSWVFEASFPVKLIDDQNKILFQGVASAPNWLNTTEKITEFTFTLKFSTSAKSGYLVIKKDNPSGLPENDKSVKIPVTFVSK